MKRMKIFYKTFLYTMILISIIILCSHMLIYFMLPDVYKEQKQMEINSISSELTEKMQHQSLTTVLDIAADYNKNKNVNILVTAEGKSYQYTTSIASATVESGEAITNSFEISNADPSESIANITQKSENNEIAPQFFSSIFSSSIIATDITIQTDITLEDGKSAAISTSVDLQPISEASSVLFMILPYTIGISILISLCAAYIFARIITDPIRSLCSSTKEMEKLKDDAVCTVTTHDEIGELAQNINSLYRSLQETIHSLEQEIQHVSEAEHMKVDFLRSASHELKTPLTSIRVILENMMLDIGKYKNHKLYMKKCKDIVDQLSLMIKDILDASSIESLLQTSLMENVILTDWLKETAEPYLLIAKAKGLQVQIEANESCISLNLKLMEKVISNLLSNAVQYTEPGHLIKLTATSEIIVIENECEPISQEHLKHLNEAFYRPDFSRTKQSGGNGLGLYIVDQILSVLNLPYTFTPYSLGMRFTILLKEA